MRSQLTSADITNIIGTGNWSADYSYHKNGDMSLRIIQSNTDTFSYTGNLMAALDGTNLNWDKNGNLIFSSHESHLSAEVLTKAEVTSHEYNWDGKLRSATKSGSTINLKYDPAGNRIFKSSTVDSVTIDRKYIVDIVGDLPVILLELDPDDNMAIKKTYIYANSQIIAQHDGSQAATKYFYLHDRLGSVRQIINTSGSVVKLYTYNPFGEALETEGSLSNPFRFSGQFFDSEIDEYYLRARQYDPYISRFTSRDPAAGKFEEPMSLHRYLYCQNEPVNRTDPTGLWWEITHRSFGQFGFGAVTPSRPYSLFDYGQLDEDYSPWNPLYTWMHFRSREAVYPNILMAAALGDPTVFGYYMHEWQDSYVHYDRNWRWYTTGHIPGDIYNEAIGLPSLDDPHNPKNIANRASERCDYTTRELEKIWFKYNIDLWMEIPSAELPTENPWYSIYLGASSPLVDY